MEATGVASMPKPSATRSRQPCHRTSTPMARTDIRSGTVDAPFVGRHCGWCSISAQEARPLHGRCTGRRLDAGRAGRACSRALGADGARGDALGVGAKVAAMLADALVNAGRTESTGGALGAGGAGGDTGGGVELRGLMLSGGRRRPPSWSRCKCRCAGRLHCRATNTVCSMSPPLPLPVRHIEWVK